MDHLFGKLGRYTRFVALSKWSLVAVAMMLMASLVVWPLVTKDKTGLRVSFVGTSTVDGNPSRPVMTNPQYYGVNENGQEYKVTGETATQQSSSLVVIDKVSAQLSKPDGSWVALTADHAEFQQDKKLIDLFGNVNVLDDQQNQFITDEAKIDATTMHVVGEKPIRGVGLQGNIVASAFEITDNGNRIIFKGGDEQLRVTVDRADKKR